MPNAIHDPRYTVFRTMLQKARDEKKLKQEDVGKRLRKTQSFVSKYERGERRIDFPEFLDIAAVLDIDVVEFTERFKAATASMMPTPWPLRAEDVADDDA
jgi:transcriptional regulator with XRE-family HTH domain